DRLVEISIGLGQGLFAVHHARAGFFAQGHDLLIERLGVDLSHHPTPLRWLGFRPRLLPRRWRRLLPRFDFRLLPRRSSRPRIPPRPRIRPEMASRRWIWPSEAAPGPRARRRR